MRCAMAGIQAVGEASGGDEQDRRAGRQAGCITRRLFIEQILHLHTFTCSRAEVLSVCLQASWLVGGTESAEVGVRFVYMSFRPSFGWLFGKPFSVGVTFCIFSVR